MKDEPVETHPAFGLAVFSRYSIGGAKHRLFGSSIDSINAISLSIRRCEVQHNLGSDHYFDRGELIEINMTEAQFATLLTTMNVGSGVPVTINHFNGQKMPDLPESKVEAVKIREKFHSNMAKWKKQLNATTGEIDAILVKKGALNQEEKKRINELTSSLVEQIKGHSSFLVDMFNESVNGAVSEAKAEVESFINSAIQRTGLEALRGQAKKLLAIDVDADRKPEAP